jgi:hypothetical protein
LPSFISEDQIERALVQKLQHLHGFDSLDCHTEDPEDLNDDSGRTNKRDAILVDRVKEAAVRLNPNIPANIIDDALEKLLDAITQGMTFCADLEIDIPALFQSKDIFKNLGTFNEYADKLLAKDEWRKGFAVYENTITGLYEACKPEILGKPIVRSVAVFQYLRGVLDAVILQKDSQGLKWAA